jgi:hypothetical protein
MPGTGDTYTFTPDPTGTFLILTAATGPVDIQVYNPGDLLVADLSNQSGLSESIFSPTFLGDWLAQNGSTIGPALVNSNFQVINSPQTLAWFGGNDSVTGSGGATNTFIDDLGGAVSLAGGPDVNLPTGSNTFVFSANVIVTGVTISGTDINGSYAPSFGAVDTIQANGNNDFSPAYIFYINNIVYSGATSLTFGFDQFGSTHIAANATIVGGPGGNALVVEANGIFGTQDNVDLSQLQFSNWTAQDTVTLIADQINQAAVRSLVRMSTQPL